MKIKKTGFTVVEILTTVTIIAILVGILIPSITAVRKMARNTREIAQLTTIGLAISAFRNDYGDYPESDCYGWADRNNRQKDYCGSQMLSEALLGWDLMGFHPKSQWRSNGKYSFGGNNNEELYEVAENGTEKEQEENLRQRKGPYLERSQTQVAHLGQDQLFNNTYKLEDEDTFVICDVFKFKKITDNSGSTRNIGAPILYYKARTNSKKIESDDMGDSIYDYRDNVQIIKAKGVEDGKLAGTSEQEHEWLDRDKFYGEEPDYDYSIRDPHVTARPWPYRPDSYLLISAGADGEYGTNDDITNFK